MLANDSRLSVQSKLDITQNSMQGSSTKTKGSKIQRVIKSVSEILGPAEAGYSG